jgi:hypothetical protein
MGHPEVALGAVYLEVTRRFPRGCPEVTLRFPRGCIEFAQRLKMNKAKLFQIDNFYNSDHHFGHIVWSFVVIFSCFNNLALIIDMNKN